MRTCFGMMFGLVITLSAAVFGAAATTATAPATQAAMPGPVRLILPPVIYAVPGIEANLYLDNAVLVLNRRNDAFDVICDKGILLEERWTFTPQPKDVGEYPIEVWVRDKSNTVVARARSLVRVLPIDRPREGNTTLLIVGDSLTERPGYPQQLLDLNSRDDVLHLKLIGCRGANNAPATGELRHEGYSGWTAEAFATFHGPLSRSGEFKRPDTGSPFVYGDTDETAHLDFARYCEQFNGGRGPDAITIFLGTNDVFTASDENIETRVDRVFKYYDALVNAFRKMRADTRIGVVLTTPPSRSQDGFRGYVGAGRQTRVQYRRNLHRLLERLMEHYGGREAEHIYLVPAYVNLDTERDFPTRPAPANARSDVEISRVIDGVHLTREGYAQIADSIYCWLKAVTYPTP
jgi:lysophospholipase L1-like esterase